MSAIIITKNTELMQRVIDEIKTCYDPEIPVDIWELGLIYELDICGAPINIALGF
jgi:metal-sulfur cluster biosynthetic enzyme